MDGALMGFGPNDIKKRMWSRHNRKTLRNFLNKLIGDLILTHHKKTTNKN